MSSFRARPSFAWLAAVLVYAGGAASAFACDISQSIRRVEAYARVNVEAVRAFYDTRAGGCAWDQSDADALTSTLLAAGDHGLDPALFHGDVLAAQNGPTEEGERDVLLTDGALRYAVALTRGLSSDPTSKADRAADAREDGEIIDGLIDAQLHDGLPNWLERLAPKFEAYTRLQSALASYRSIAEAGGWDVTPMALAKKKKRSRYIPALRRRLAIEGDLQTDNGAAYFDDELDDAIAHFQQRNGLAITGRPNRKTIDRLNISAAERVAQLSLNLERLRATARDVSPTRVEVNAPAATAVLYRDGAVVLAMNAVVGAPGHDTPTLTSTIDTIILNPTWTIPQSIIQNEILPAIKKNRRYLARNHMYWEGDQLIQEPGPHNSLGRIKFDFPNRHSVYLHDTPARRLFLDPERAQSHGCVRLEKPLDLAVELLRDNPKWDREALERAIERGKIRHIPLDERMPVTIVYRTAFIDDEGLVNFRPDIYGLDTQLTLALSHRIAER